VINYFNADGQDESTHPLAPSLPHKNAGKRGKKEKPGFELLHYSFV